jgi:hypothetical protein
MGEAENVVSISGFGTLSSALPMKKLFQNSV